VTLNETTIYKKSDSCRIYIKFFIPTFLEPKRILKMQKYFLEYDKIVTSSQNI